jgi:PAS domain S-box-containing protein
MTPDVRNGVSVPSLPETELEARVKERFGVLPNFFRLSAETPEITANLWGFAQAAYLDNPLPSLFKERLFVHLSRFCEERYCIARHAGFLAGLGRPSGDARAPLLTVDEIVRLLTRPFPYGEHLTPLLLDCTKGNSPLTELPKAESEIEATLFAFASHVFLQTADAPICYNALKSLLDEVRFEYLILFLSFVRTAHYWTKVHPELVFEEDIKELLATHEALAECILRDSEAPSAEASQRVLDELPSLREQAGRAINLMAAIVDSSDDAIISKNLDGIITSWNRGAEQLFGFAAHEAIGQNITIVIPEDRREEERMILDQVRAGKRVDHFETVRRRKDGSTLNISVTISPVKDSGGRIFGASKVARDISEPKRMEAELRASEERFRTLAASLETQVGLRTAELERQNVELEQQSARLRDVSGRLLQSQDHERRHIARELHDSAGQTLTVLGMNVARLVSDTKQKAPDLAGQVEETQQLVGQLTQDIRTAAYLLHPPMLDEQGLSSALGWYVRGLTERSNLEVQLNIPEDIGRLSPDMELTVFRIVQECLTNIHRHSGSKTAEIKIVRRPESVVLEIRDEGNGIPAEKLANIQKQGASFGIRGMRERVQQVQGEMTIESNGRGTMIAMTLPLPTATHSRPTEDIGRTQSAG